MNTVQILKDARALIADEKNWTRGYYSRKENGELTMPYSGEAVCFCALGAIHKVADIRVSTPLPEEFSVLLPLYERISGQSWEFGVIDYNDRRSHAEVLALFDRAIARAESEAA